MAVKVFRCFEEQTAFWYMAEHAHHCETAQKLCTHILCSHALKELQDFFPSMLELHS